MLSQAGCNSGPISNEQFPLSGVLENFKRELGQSSFRGQC